MPDVWKVSQHILTVAELRAALGSWADDAEVWAIGPRGRSMFDYVLWSGWLLCWCMP